MDQIKNSNFTFKNYLTLYYNNYIRRNYIAGKENILTFSLENKKERLTDRLNKIKQKVKFSRKKTISDDQINADNKTRDAIETEESKKKIFSITKGRDFFEDLRSYYVLKKRNIFNNVHEAQKLYFNYDKNAKLTGQEIKAKLENNKKWWKRNTKKFNIFLFFFISSYLLYQRYYKRMLLRLKPSHLVLGVGVLTIVSNIYLQTKINDHYKYKYKEISKDVNNKM